MDGRWRRSLAISDMFNNALKARVDALCNELSALIRSDLDFVAAGPFQSQSQGAHGNLRRASSSLLVTEGPDPGNWWPTNLGIEPRSPERSPLRLFSRHPAPRYRHRREGDWFYDTQGHQISGSPRSNNRDRAPSVSRASWATLI